MTASDRDTRSRDLRVWARRPAIAAAVAVGVVLLSAAAGRAAETVVYDFTGGTDGAGPEAGLVVNQKTGRLFGTTYNGGKTRHGPQDGTVYVLVPPAAGQTAWTRRLVYAFRGGPEDGRIPWGRLFAGKKGVFYGTTLEGGIFDRGTVFQLTPPATGQTGWTETVLYSFKGGSDGISPGFGLVADANGDLYGTTSQQGDPQCNCGTVFMLSPPQPGQLSWTETVIHTFAGGSKDGAFRQGELLFDKNTGGLFGAAYSGGAFGLGVVFALTPPTPLQQILGIKTWNETFPHAFTGGGDGAHPNGTLIGGDGNLVGTAQAGGNPACQGGCGTVFQLVQMIAGNPAYSVFVRHSFFGNTTGNPPSDGAAPMAGLVRDAHGALWGTTLAGGGSAIDRTGCGDVGCGTVFKITPSASPLFWKLEVEYRFFGLVDGGRPMAPLAGDAAGNVYGTTFSGGLEVGTGFGTVFQVTS
jgi:hypothetical protein